MRRWTDVMFSASGARVLNSSRYAGKPFRKEKS
jgi:hypothetical protein